MKNTVVTLFLLIALLCLGTTANSQDKLTENEIVPYEKLDVKPELDLGEGRGFVWWLFGNLRYPQTAVDAGFEGGVKFSFVVSGEGIVEDVNILSGEGVFGDEVKRVMAMCPKWMPGELQGAKVGVKFVWEVSFSLCGDEKVPRITGYPIDPVTDIIIWEPYDWVYTPPTYFPYGAVPQKPTFMGGGAFPSGDGKSFLEWVIKRVQYPAEADGAKGRVMVRFRVTKEGEVAKVEVIRGVHEACDREAAKVIASSPKWEPGKDENGAPVEVIIVVPVIFRPN